MPKDSSNLDLLRSVAVLLVVQSHLWDFIDVQSPALLIVEGSLSSLGTVGVLLFFIHTSLVLMYSLDRLDGDAGRFYIRRAFRIYPLSVLTIVLMLALQIPPSHNVLFSDRPLGNLAANLLLVQNFTGSHEILGVMWSLPLEVQMYLLLPFLYKLAPRLNPFVLVALGVLVKVALHLLGLPGVMPYAPWFCMGIASFLISRRVKPVWEGRWFASLLGAFVAAHSLLYYYVGDNRRTMAASGMLSLLLAAILPRFTDIASPFVKRVCHAIATYSYSAYLWHFPITWFAFRKLAAYPAWERVTVYALLMIAVPFALYHAVEAPMIRKGAALAASL